MFQEALGVKTFTKGLNYYLTEMYYKAATPEDLHRNLQKAYDEENLGNSLNIAEVMSTWENQAGFPVLTVEKIDDEFVLTQKRFGRGDEIYSIPVTYTTKSLRNFATKTPKAWMHSKQMKISNPVEDDWLILNIQFTGYYQPRYGKSIWTGLIDTLNYEHEIIPTTDRLQLFKVMFDSMRENSIEIYWGLKLMGNLNHESQASVWREANFMIKFLNDNLFGTEVMEKYQKFMQSLVEPHMKRLGYEDRDGEKASDASLRNTVRILNCDAFNEECLNYELEKLKSFIATASGEHTRNLCYALRLADSTTYQIVIDSLLRESAIEDRWKTLYDPGCSLDKENLKKYLAITLDKSNNLHSGERGQIIRSTVQKSAVGVEVALEFLEEKFEEIIEL
jgi:aminopeptidase N